MKTTAGGEGVEIPLEQFHYVPGGFLYESASGESTPFADDRGKFRADEGEGTLLSQRRLDAERATARLTSFDANAIDLAPGVVMRVVDHPRGEVNAEPLLVLSSSISGGASSEWAHHCEACSAAVAYRPPLGTPKPRVSGVESATVVGQAGEEIHTDEFGRVRVQFHWDRLGTMDERSSCWIHVSQPWGGAGYGGVNLPRVGQEVIVDFLGGDPDRPIVVGRVYTNLQKVPYKLPDNKTQSGWKSNSSPETGGYNEIMFEDAAGKELVRIQAEKDLHRLVKHDEQDTVGHDRTRLVGHDETLTVVNNRTRMVGVNEDIAIGVSQNEVIGVNRTVMVGVNHSETIGALKTEMVGLASIETVGTIKAVTVGDEYTVTCGASKMTMDKSGNVVVEATNITLRSSGPVLVEAGGNIKVQASGLVKIVGTTVNVN
jgi:type VI secretion system secreted protein VgrG